MGTLIKNIRSLAVEVVGESARDNSTNERRIARRLYKDTECGISFSATAKGVVVSGYAEGTDSECYPYFIQYPFDIDTFWKTVEDADIDGCTLFEETHCSKCGAENVENGICSDCEEKHGNLG